MNGEPPLVARILMVDDRVENLVALEAILEPLGHELLRATSGEEALRQLLLHDVAVILLDVQMPGMNGFETAHLVKARPRSRHTPIIFLTAISKEEAYVFEGYSAGAVDYMFKPFNPDILRSKVTVFVDLYLTAAQLARQGERLRQSEQRELELRHRAHLLESEARLAHIVGSATDVILAFGDDRRITLFNAAAERAFGITAIEAEGRPVDALFAGPLPAADGEDAEADSATREAVGVRADGAEFPVELSVSTLALQGERVHTVILRDITERRRAELSLANAMEELQIINEQLNDRSVELERAMGTRSRFYANMSHELRTPINAILGYSALLLDQIYGPLNDKQTNGIERTNVAAKHLLELVNDILDLSKIEAGKVELQVESVSFPELICDLFVTVAPFAEQHGVELALDACEESFSIVSDARRIRQIALNLLSNAIKFGGGKPVEVRCTRREDGGLHLEVKDHGAGIGVEDQDRVFEEFVQLGADHDSPGTGLGLPISRRLAEILGGSLTLRSSPGDGSTFELFLPPSDPELLQMSERRDVAGSV